MAAAATTAACAVLRMEEDPESTPRSTIVIRRAVLPKLAGSTRAASSDPSSDPSAAAAMNARDLRARGLAPQARAPRRSGTAAGAAKPRAVPFAGRLAIEAWRAPAPVAAPAASIARVALMVQFASSLPRCAIRPRLPRIRAALRAESRVLWELP